MSFEEASAFKYKCLYLHLFIFSSSIDVMKCENVFVIYFHGEVAYG